MDLLKNAAQSLNNAGNNNNNGDNNNNGGDPKNAVMGVLNNAMGGGQAAEQKEDYLDKAIDLAQEHVLKAGPQNNEDAIEQMKDKVIAQTIRDQYKNATGKDFPIAPKS